MNLLLVVPCYNEDKVIPYTVKKIKKYQDNMIFKLEKD